MDEDNLYEGKFHPSNIEHRKARYEEVLDYAKERGGLLLTNRENYLGSRNSVFTFKCEKHNNTFFLEKYQINRGNWCAVCGKENAKKLMAMHYENRRNWKKSK